MSPHGQPGHDAVERLIAQLPPDLRDSRDVPIVASQVRRALAELAKCPPDTMINDEVSWWQRTVLALLSAGLDLSPWLAGDAPDVAAEVEREVRGMGNAQAAPEPESTVEPEVSQPEPTAEPRLLMLEEPELHNLRSSGLWDSTIAENGFATWRGKRIDDVLGWGFCIAKRIDPSDATRLIDGRKVDSACLSLPIARPAMQDQRHHLREDQIVDPKAKPWVVKPGELPTHPDVAPHTYRFRPRPPLVAKFDKKADDHERDSDGKLKPSKYLGASRKKAAEWARDAMTPVFIPAALRAYTGDCHDFWRPGSTTPHTPRIVLDQLRSHPLLITEGEKKAALLAQCGYVAVGLTGIDCAHDTAHKKQGERYKLRCELVELGISGRDVYAFLDASDKPSPREPDAAQRIADMAYAEGARAVYFCTPPSASDQKGCDDLYVLAARGGREHDLSRDCAQTLDHEAGKAAIEECLRTAQLLPNKYAATTATSPGTHATTSLITLHGAEEIFKPLADMQWISSDLMLGSGRPTMLVAYSGTGKSLIAQALALAVAAGKPIWGKYEIAGPMSVVHLDYEQGTYATYRRYQRLALGHGISESEIGVRLHVASHPPIYLTDKRASDELQRISEGRHVVIIDSLRAAAPGVDENDSKVREYLDLMSRLSEATGTAYVVIHHAGKGGDAQTDARHVARGSSSIFDASGCVFAVKRGRKKGDPLEVTMAKSPASAEGQALADFGLAIEDVASESRPVRLVWSALDPMRHSAGPNAAAKYQSDAKTILQIVARNPGITLNVLVLQAGIQKARAIGVVKSLVDEGRIRTESGEGKAVRHFAIGKESSDDD